MEPYIGHGTGVSAALADGLPVYNYPDTQNIGDRGIDRQYIDLVRRDQAKDRCLMTNGQLKLKGKPAFNADEDQLLVKDVARYLTGLARLHEEDKTATPN